MDKKILVILVAAAVILGAIGLAVHQRNQPARPAVAAAGTDGKFLPSFDPNAVAKIVIQSPAGMTTLEKSGDVWIVAGRNYAANFPSIAELIRTLWDLKAVQDVRAGASQFGRLELLEPGKNTEGVGTLVDLQDASGKRLAGLILGKSSFASQTDESAMGGFPIGRFVVAAGTQGPVALVSETFQSVLPQPETWLLRDFVSPENLQAISVTGANPTDSWSVIRIDASSPWQLADAKPGETLSSEPAASIPSSLAGLSVADVKPEPAPITNPRQATVRTFDGFVYTFEMGADENGRIPVRVTVAAELPETRTPAPDEKPEDKERLNKEFAERQAELTQKLSDEKKFEGRTFMLDAFAVDALLRPRTAIVAKPSPTPSPSPSPKPARKKK